MTQLIDPRPLESPEYWETDYSDPAIRWTINYHEYNKKLGKIIPRSERGCKIAELLDIIAYNLNEGIECDGYIDASESAPPIDPEIREMYTYNAKCAENTMMHWRVYDPGDEKKFDKHEDGFDNNELLYILETGINKRQEFKFEIAKYDPTP